MFEDGDYMSISEKDMRLEEIKLEEVKKIIDEELQSAGGDLFQEEKDLKEFQKLMWESQQEMDEEELAQFLYENEGKVDRLETKLKKLRKLVKVKDKPYFASIVFNDEPIYIGITSVKKGLDYHVVDWRAPMASMFYDYDELGEASYKAPGGVETGIISQKRQYLIEEGKIKDVFESGMNIQDDMLQNVLAQSKSDKMRNIVNTIQQEQNEVIRNERSKNIVVQGIAGSGKTSVALHRIAFLLYRFEVLTSQNVLIFSPNGVFSEYISNVLPDLGEENTLQTTYHEFASSFIDEYYRVEPYSSFVERYYKGVKQDNDLIRFKLSDKMATVIEEFVKYYEKASKFTDDIEYKEKVILREELNELLHERYSNKPLFERVELIATEIPLVWHQKGIGFGGKLDILAYKDGKFIIYDNKTSRSVHDSYACQVSAYKNAVEQMSPGLKVNKCKIIHLANENNMSDWQKKQHQKLGNLIEITNMTKAWKHFKILLELYQMRNNKYF